MAQANERLISEMVAMGLDREQSRKALAACNGNKERAIDWIFSSNTTSVPVSTTTDVPYISTEDELLNQAIEKSLQETRSPNTLGSFEPLNPEERIREPNVPAGLKNIGNTCYVNSLIQTYFSLPEFVKAVLAFKPHSDHLHDNDNANSRKSASIRLVQQLQKLFASLIGSSSKYVDPSAVLSALVDDFGNPIVIGEQQDVGEFNINFIARAEEGMLAARPLEQAPVVEEPLEALKREGSLSRSATLNTMQQLLQSGDSIVARLFYGKQVEVLRAYEADGNLVEQKNEVAFGQIQLNVDMKDLYSAWDESYYCNISDYITAQGHKTQATQEVWLQRLPSVLLFQIQRVKYDIASGMSVKDHSEFSFPEVVFPDRYMEIKACLSASLRAQVYKLKENVSQLSAKISEFEKYCEGQVSLDKMLKNTAKFLEDQVQNTFNPINPECPLYETECLEELGSEDRASIVHAQTVVKQFAESARASLKTMKKIQRELRQQIEAKFDIDELKDNPYYLHAILVHEGQAGSGHYFAYIHDRTQQKWRKYNDIRVTEVSGEEVGKVSTGGQGLNSAYCLVYTDRTIAKSLNDPSLLESYPSLFSEQIRKELEDENARLQKELIDWRYGRLMKNLQDLYTHRLVLVQAQHASFQSHQNIRSEAVSYELINFTLYLKLKNQPFLSLWHLLDICVREVNDSHLGLDQMDKSDPFYLKIKSQFYTSCRDGPNRIDISHQERVTIEKLLNDFFASYRDASISCYILKKMNAGAYLESIMVMTNYIHTPYEHMTQYRRSINDCAKVLLLRLTSVVTQYFYAGQADEALQWAKHAATHGVINIDLSDPHLTQCYVNLSTSLDWAKANAERSKLTEAIAKDFVNLLQDLRSSNIIPSVEVDVPADYAELTMSLDKNRMYGWMEGWKTDCVAHQLPQQLLTLKTSNLKPWVEAHTRISSVRVPLNPADFRAFESRGGISPS